VPLSPGSTTWNEEQSRRNFQLVQKVVVAGYEDSPLAKHPLAEQAGGDPRHGGGQQFASRNDPDWQILKAFVLGDLNITPDGKYVVAGAVRAAKPPANLMNVIDTRTNEIAWILSMSPAPSPMAIMANPDGSTKSIFAQGAIHGFSVVDFATHARTNVINLPTIPAAQQNPFGGASHGIAVTADQKNPVGQQQPEQYPLRVFAAGLDANRRRRSWRKRCQLVDDLA